MENLKQVIAEHSTLATLTVIFIVLFFLSRLGLKLLNKKYGDEWYGMYYDKFRSMPQEGSPEHQEFLREVSKISKKSLTKK